MRVAVDSQSLTYLFKAWADVVEPTGPFALEQKALFRTFMYCDECLYATPTTRGECATIQNDELRDLHDSFFATLIDTVYNLDDSKVECLAQQFELSHRGRKDCRIVAEAIVGEIDMLLSYDKKLVNHLAPRSAPLIIRKPSEHWSALGIPSGTRPRKLPYVGNPLEHQKWWFW